jgi:hypothetical protein
VNRKFGIVGIVVLALLLASTGVFAESNRDRMKLAKMPPNSGIYDRTLLRPDPNVIIEMPTTAQPEAPQTGATAAVLSKGGPSDQSVQAWSDSGFSLVTPRGAAMSSKKQIADRQIRRIIKRLD